MNCEMLNLSRGGVSFLKVSFTESQWDFIVQSGTYVDVFGGTGTGLTYFAKDTDGNVAIHCSQAQALRLDYALGHLL
jgi:hypothetical protein